MMPLGFTGSQADVDQREEEGKKNGSNGPKYSTYHGSPTPSSSSSTTGSSSGSGGSGGGGGNGQRKYNNSLNAQINMLQAQANSIRNALGANGFHAALEIKLDNIKQELKEDRGILLEGFRKRMGEYRDAARDNERAESDATAANAANRGRERTAALQQAALQGAGETDALRSTQMSLRNWDANQGEIQRSYFDTVQSINAGIVDSNVDTKTALANMYAQADEDRGTAWTNYYNQQSESWTQLGNIMGQLAQTQALRGKGYKGSSAGAKNAFQEAASYAGQAYESKGLPKWVKQWDGANQVQGRSNLTDMTPRQEDVERNEGATLRTW